jgi:hypothetical protein
MTNALVSLIMGGVCDPRVGNGDNIGGAGAVDTKSAISMRRKPPKRPDPTRQRGFSACTAADQRAITVDSCTKMPILPLLTKLVAPATLFPGPQSDKLHDLALAPKSGHKARVGTFLLAGVRACLDGDRRNFLAVLEAHEGFAGGRARADRGNSGEGESRLSN